MSSHIQARASFSRDRGGLAWQIVAAVRRVHRRASLGLRLVLARRRRRSRRRCGAARTGTGRCGDSHARGCRGREGARRAFAEAAVERQWRGRGRPALESRVCKPPITGSGSRRRSWCGKAFRPIPIFRWGGSRARCRRKSRAQSPPTSSPWRPCRRGPTSPLSASRRRDWRRPKRP